MTATWEIREGDALERLREIPDGSVDAIVTDPPYGLGFMGKQWDAPGKSFVERRAETNNRFDHIGGNHNPANSVDAARTARSENRKAQEWHEAWAREAVRVLKPGGHLLAFGGTRTYHRLACAVEDAGFEIRDEVLSIFEATEAGRQFLASLTPEQIAALDKLGGGPLAWLYGSGFPKSLDVSKAIDKAARGVPQGAADPTSPNHGKYRTTVTEGKRWEGDSGQGYGAGGSRFRASTSSERTTANGTGITPDPDVAAAVDRPSSTLDATASEWSGWGTALKPAHEPIVMARKPLVGTVAGNVLAHGTGALNVDGCRIAFASAADERESKQRNRHADFGPGPRENAVYGEDLRARGAGGNYNAAARWPANVVLDEDAAGMLDEQTGETRDGRYVGRNRDPEAPSGNVIYGARNADARDIGYGGAGGASRFSYCAKASSAERGVGNLHPTVKPTELMRWLVRLVTPPGGLVLDPFAGSGTTGIAAMREGFSFVGIEREAQYVAIARERIRQDAPLLNVPAEITARSMASTVAGDH